MIAGGASRIVPHRSEAINCERGTAPAICLTPRKRRYSVSQKYCQFFGKFKLARQIFEAKIATDSPAKITGFPQKK